MMAGKPGGRATVYTVAERAGVSVATVSRVLQEPALVRAATRERVLDAIRELNYVPHGGARSLASKKHHAHGLVLPELHGTYYSELLMGYESVASDAGQSVLLLVADGRPDTQARMLRLAGQVDGIVLMGSVPVSATTLSAVRRKVPLIGVSGAVHDIETFTTESRRSFAALTRHLLDDHGYRRPVFVGDPDLAFDVRERYEAFCAEAPDATGPVRVGYELEDGRGVAESFLNGELETDALVCANDELALGIIDRLTLAGHDGPLPVAVTGFDDVFSAGLVTPRLTTVAQPVRELGAQAAARMLELVAGAGPVDGAAPHQLPTHLVIRESCGCPAPTPVP